MIKLIEASLAEPLTRETLDLCTEHGAPFCLKVGFKESLTGSCTKASRSFDHLKVFAPSVRVFYKFFLDS